MTRIEPSILGIRQVVRLREKIFLVELLKIELRNFDIEYQDKGEEEYYGNNR